MNKNIDGGLEKLQTRCKKMIKKGKSSNAGMTGKVMTIDREMKRQRNMLSHVQHENDMGQVDRDFMREQIQLR